MAKNKKRKYKSIPAIEKTVPEIRDSLDTNSSAVLFDKAAKLLYLAVAISILMLMVAVFLPDGRAAIQAIGGVPSGLVDERSAQWALLLDTLFPVFYGGGLAVLFAGFRGAGNGPLIRLVLMAVLVGVGADFIENGLIFPVMTGTGETLALQFPLTVIKFGMLTFAGIIGVSVLPDATNNLGRLTKLLLRYVFPVSIAVLLSGIGGETARSVIGLGFTLSLAILALYAQDMKSRY